MIPLQSVAWFGRPILLHIDVEHVPSHCVCRCALIVSRMAIMRVMISTCFAHKLEVPVIVVIRWWWDPRASAQITRRRTLPTRFDHRIVFSVLLKKSYPVSYTIWFSTYARITFHVSPVCGGLIVAFGNLCLSFIANRRAKTLLNDVLIYLNDLGTVMQSIICGALIDTELYQTSLNSEFVSHFSKVVIRFSFPHTAINKEDDLEYQVRMRKLQENYRIAISKIDIATIFPSLQSKKISNLEIIKGLYYWNYSLELNYLLQKSNHSILISNINRFWMKLYFGPLWMSFLRIWLRFYSRCCLMKSTR